MTAQEMLERIVTGFRLAFYQEVFSQDPEDENSMTTVETFCMDVIDVLQRPTINEFARFIGISAPNAAYKVNSLIRKGYLKKERSEEDKREYFLIPTEQYEKYRGLYCTSLSTIMQRVEGELNEAEERNFCRFLRMVMEEEEKDLSSYRQKHHLPSVGHGNGRRLS